VAGAVGTGGRSDEADVSRDENDWESGEIDGAERRRLRQFLESFDADERAGGNDSTPDVERATKEVSKAALRTGESAASPIEGGASGAPGAVSKGAFAVGAPEDDDGHFEGESVEKENRGEEEEGCESGEGNGSGRDSLEQKQQHNNQPNA
jgi:hypothetical protein